MNSSYDKIDDDEEERPPSMWSCVEFMYPSQEQKCMRYLTNLDWKGLDTIDPYDLKKCIYRPIKESTILHHLFHVHHYLGNRKDADFLTTLYTIGKENLLNLCVKYNGMGHNVVHYAIRNGNWSSLLFLKHVLKDVKLFEQRTRYGATCVEVFWCLNESATQDEFTILKTLMDD